jgi:indolepyruvate ferredoxin oxidoreductase, beta subunit
MSERPIAVLIAALGGEGGGVLTDWIVEAALAADLPVQATSIPGVAQRTGATTYYVEMFPVTNAALAGKRPTFALYPSPAGIDLMLASEILEAGRALENGYVTPDRTTLIAATHRLYAIAEKQAMGDGRFDISRILAASRELSRRNILFDLTADTKARNLSLNAVILGAAAASGVLPIAREHFVKAITDQGIAVDQNIAAFNAGWALGQNGVPDALAPRDDRARVSGTVENLLLTIPQTFPLASVALVSEGVKRCVDYQDQDYAKLYLDRLKRVVAIDRDGALTAETARYLALWMSYEDVIRVADLKIRPERFAKVRSEVQAKPDEPLHITEFLKPGVDEVSSLLPPRLGRWLAHWAERRGLVDKLHMPMRLKSTSMSGFLRLWLLAKLRPWRRRSYRFAEEQRAIEQWLETILRAAPRSQDLAREIALCARLLKGYSDTYRRGRANYRRILEGAILPLLDRPEGGAEIVRRLREAALADPDGTALERALAPPPEKRAAAE